MPEIRGSSVWSDAGSDETVNRIGGTGSRGTCPEHHCFVLSVHKTIVLMIDHYSIPRTEQLPVHLPACMHIY